MHLTSKNNEKNHYAKRRLNNRIICNESDEYPSNVRLSQQHSLFTAVFMTTYLLLLLSNRYSSFTLAFSPKLSIYVNHLRANTNKSFVPLEGKRSIALPHVDGSQRLSTQLQVWWFGGSSNEYSASSGANGEDSCELVAVRIDRTSPNSRRISAEITVPRPIDDVWAILTDYDNLATHVPNLVESRRVGGGLNSYNSRLFSSGSLNPNNLEDTSMNGPTQGDGNYKCRLYQMGAQKILGFEFGASLVMEMSESIVSGKYLNRDVNGVTYIPEDRRIGFKCIESQFFSGFDGEWRVQSSIDVTTGEPTTVVSYVVDVRPKGPVPVAALEWRIREDVPTNLRAVKKASQEVGYEGVMAMRRHRSTRSNNNVVDKSSSLDSGRIWEQKQQLSPKQKETNFSSGRLSSAGAEGVRRMREMVGNVASTTATKARLMPVRVKWYDDETMAKYLRKDK